MKIFEKKDHSLKGAFTYGRDSLLRINQVYLKADEEMGSDPFHYHKEGVQTFVVVNGAIVVEVNNQEVSLTKEQILQIEPGEKYRLLKHTGDTNVVVICTVNSGDDRVVV